MNHNVPMTEILPYLYLGNRSDANNVNGLKENGIGYILNLTTSATNYPQESNIISCHINILDSVCQCLKDTYQSAFDFIDKAQKCNSKVLIHCEAGISRSPTITVAYLIYKQKMEALEAYNFVKKLRPIVSPNFGFMGQLMELENELLPEKVAMRMEKEAKLQKEANRLREEHLKTEVKEPLVESSTVENKIQLNMPIRLTTKPPSSLSLKRPLMKKLNLSIDLPDPVLLSNAANNCMPPSNNVAQQSNLVQIKEISNQNVNPNVVILNSSDLPKTTSSSSKLNQQTSSSKQTTLLTDSLKDGQKTPKSTSQPQISNSINQAEIKNTIVDSNNNVTPTDTQIDIKAVVQKDENVKSINDAKIDDKSIVLDKPISNPKESTVNSTSIQTILSTDKSMTKPTIKQVDKPKIDKIVEKSIEMVIKVTKQTESSIITLPRSVPTSNACTPSNKQLTICDLLIPPTKSASQNSLYITNRPQVKPLRPSSLFLNSNANTTQSKAKLKSSAITPSSLCSPLTAFAVSSKSPTLTFSGNLSSPFDTSEKMTKRRWLAETNCYQEFSQEFSSPECKKKNKQKKLKNISVEVN